MAGFGLASAEDIAMARFQGIPMGVIFRTALLALAATASLAAAPSWAESVDLDALMEPGPMEERTLGDPAAPVTVVEYVSLTCPHCAKFDTTVFDALKTKYIDTGKVFFVMREFPLDPLALAAIMGARCAPAEDYFPIIDTLFSEQSEWAFVDDPGRALLGKLSKHGFTEQSFSECLARQGLAEAIIEVERRAQEQFGVHGTPAFFINGEMHVGGMDVAELDLILEPLLAQPSE
jgi:protein-disulfide isomerase